MDLLASGITFRDDARNRALWRRWYRLPPADMFGYLFVSFVGDPLITF